MEKIDMPNPDEPYDRAVSRLLTDHLEHNVPDDTDLWSTVQQRLAARNGAPASVEGKQGWWQNLSTTLSSPGKQIAQKKRPYLGFAFGTIGLALVALLTVISISRFAQIGNGVPTKQPTTLSDVLFSIPVGGAEVHWHTDTWLGVTGIAAAPDGTFYIADADRRLLHYSSTGGLLGVQSYAASRVPLFMTMQDDHLWLYETMPAVDTARTVVGFFKVFSNGNYLGGYTWTGDYVNPFNDAPSVMSGTESVSIVAGIINLQIGGDGQFMVETAPLTDKNVPDYTKSYLIQAVNADGKPDPKLLPGYPAGGKYYTSEVTPGSKSGYVTNGDVRVEITSTQYIRRLDVRSVRPDGSFYVISEERATPAPNANGGDTVNVFTDANYIYHYSASGKLIERARIPGIFVPHIDTARRLTQDANGTFYWLQTVFPEQGGDPTSLEIHRINFFPAGQPLPGEEAMATPSPTITIEQKVPSPVPPDTALDSLISKADVIAHVRVFGYNEEGQDGVLLMEVQKWLKNAASLDTKNLYLRISPELWDQMPASFKSTKDPAGNYGKNDNYILFLSKAPADPTYGDLLYYLTGGSQGAFLVLDGKMQDAPLPQYNGMSADDFKRLITGEPTPVPTIAAQATPPRLPNSPPVSLSREGDGFRLDVYTGTAGFSAIDSPWISSSQIMLRWNPVRSDDNKSPVHYLVDVNSGTMRELLSGRGGVQITADPKGKQLVLVEHRMDTRVEIHIYDVETGHEEVVWHPDPSNGQWAPQGLFDGFGNGQPPADVRVQWIDDNYFILTVRQEHKAAGNQTAGEDRGALFLVSVPNKKVSKLSDYGKVLGLSPQAEVLLREGGIDGSVRLLEPPYQAISQPVETSGLWTVGWSFSPDYAKVAWLEMTPPPGDWSQRLPNGCCSGDPAPTLKDMAVFDHVTGQVRRFEVPDYAWSSPDVSWRQSETLRWSKDGSALFYSAHPAQDRTALYLLSLGGQRTKLAEMDSRAGVQVVAEANDGSIYFVANGIGCQNCIQLMHFRADGIVEVVRPNGVPLDWVVDGQGRLEALKDGGVQITDLATGLRHQMNFPGELITGGEIGWSTLSNLVPISPDGTWAAYAGSQSDAIMIGPDGRPTDRGKTIRIVLIK